MMFITVSKLQALTGSQHGAVLYACHADQIRRSFTEQWLRYKPGLANASAPAAHATTTTAAAVAFIVSKLEDEVKGEE
jgi:hypothetical protein